MLVQYASQLTMNHREQELIQAAKDGDNRSFDELVRLYDSRILQVAHGIMGNMQDAYDAYQEGVIRAYQNLNSFRSDSSFGTCLTRIVINQALNMKKKLRWNQRLSLEQLQDVAPAFLEDSSATPDEVYITNELSAEIQKGLEVLSDRERAVFVLKHMHGYKLREIGVMINCAEGTVKNYLFRATRKLRKVLHAHSVSTERSAEQA